MLQRPKGFASGRAIFMPPDSVKNDQAVKSNFRETLDYSEEVIRKFDKMTPEQQERFRRGDM